MGRFNLFLAGFGFPDCYLESHYLSTLIVHKKGDIWRTRTGETYKENIFKYNVTVLYETGFGPAFDEIIKAINNDVMLNKVIASCRHIEIQVSIAIGEDFRLPQIHLTSEQMAFFGRIGAELEVHIS